MPRKKIKHVSRYLTVVQFKRIIADRIKEARENIIKLKGYEKRGLRYKRVWIEPHTVPKYKTHGHYMRVLAKIKPTRAKAA